MPKNTFSLSAVLMLVILSVSLPGYTGGKDEGDAIFKKMAGELSRVGKKLPNRTVAVYGFEVIGRPDDSYGKFATEKLTHEIVNAGDLMVIERSRIDQVLKEQSLSMSGALDSSTAAHIGRILAVDAVIIGTIHVKGSGAEFIARVIQSEKGIILASVNEKLVMEKAVEKDAVLKDDSSKDGTDGSSQIDISSGDDASFTSSKNVFSSSEPVSIGYSGFPGYQNDWITLVKASQPDDTYGDWFYTYGKKSSSHSFSPVEPGEYELRAYFNWPAGGYVVKKRLKIRVK